jgi:dienelactone hydrolase
MANYDPFARGPHPVGVRTETWTDDDRSCDLTVEVWYPASAAHAGHDLDPATQDAYQPVWGTDDAPAAEMPLVRQTAVRDATPAELPGQLVVFSHGYAGWRREATFVCTHLASHGYVVVSADHPASTSWEVDATLSAPDPISREDSRLVMARQRKGDVPFLVAESERRGYARAGDVGFTGISLGGWTTLIAPSVEPRVRVIAAMCPAGGTSPIAPGRNTLADELDLSWPDGVQCLHMVADRDAWLPLYGHLGMFARFTGPSRMVILLDADHNHFVDDIPTSHAWYHELTVQLAETYPDGETNWAAIAQTIVPIDQLVEPDVAYALWRGLTVAQFDAHLRGLPEAQQLLDERLRSEAAGIGARVLTIDTNVQTTGGKA